ncbi:helix-turn-helix domain-containing protein [Duganella sp. FT92W]|uniref:Helix-turn-helix domain-containing protein n=1 Tax=Pseudoduganella rivuli TaxID=2666085 RepID=A0A7X2LPL0_9BURK|nr:helix-turn-helix transcriptional regulator [Pseudoduganella rivuli]MRV70395.1 helix-turn-helix domain-containing protein [Pseudoduganella rivuli]
MDFLQNALLRDAQDRPIADYELIQSTDFDEIRVWSDQVYMPYKVVPSGAALQPDSALHAIAIGSMTLSRFSYGIPVHLRDFSMGPGMGMALTTVRGNGRHGTSPGASADTPAGHSFLVDTSRTDYRVDFDAAHLQVNITFPHQYLEELFLRWYGAPAGDDIWRRKVAFGGPDSAWLALLHYVCRCVAETPGIVTGGPLGSHLEEMLGMHMLSEWIRHNGTPARSTTRTGVVPRCVKIAEEYMEAHARACPTLSAIALAAGVSVRTLSNSFRHFRGHTPMDFLREQRLQGVRKALMAAQPGSTVVAIANLYGYASLGGFAAVYFKRFGEYPSMTLNRLRPH